MNSLRKLPLLPSILMIVFAAFMVGRILLERVLPQAGYVLDDSVAAAGLILIAAIGGLLVFRATAR